MKKIKDLGNFKLRETDNSEVFYVSLIDTDIIISETIKEFNYFDEVGQIKVYHDGLYFGSPEQMNTWLKENITNHLINENIITQDGETMLGEKLWKWNIQL